MMVTFRGYVEHVVIKEKRVIIVDTGKRFCFGSGFLVLNNGILSVEEPDEEFRPLKVRRLERLGAGLLNSENNCFCNAVLQAIRAADKSKTLQHILLDIDDSVKDLTEGTAASALQEVSLFDASEIVLQFILN